MKFSRTALMLMILLLAVAVAGAQVIRESPNKVPTGKGWGEASDIAPAARAGASTNGIAYHGGPLMLNTPNIYLIWYGCWGFSGQTCTPSHASDSQGTVGLINTFFGGLGGSGYELINSTYYDGSNNYVTGDVNTAATVNDNYSQGKRLSDSKVRAVVSRAISNGLGADPNGLYFVLTSSDVSETSGFCSFYCGWHDHTTINGTDIKFSFVGNPDRCPRACEAQTTSPNGNSGADGMANIMGHEQEEAISDPDLNAWYDSSGQENADKCAWRFGPTKSSNGAQYNETIGGLNWLIQMNWQNACGGGCAQSGTLHQTSGCVFY